MIRKYLPLDSGDYPKGVQDKLLFLKSSYKTISILGMVGLGISMAYLAITPKEYEATAQIAMAQIGVTNNSLNPLGINIEEPAQLISRLSMPTSFSEQAIVACGLDGTPASGTTLAKVIKLRIAKGISNVVELKTSGPSPEAAKTCANAIFELIKITQSQILKPYIEEAELKLADDELRLQKAKDLVAKADKSGSVIGAAYLSTRDEIRYLLDEITSLKNVVTSNQSRVTHLIVPIYVNDTPISPKKGIALFVGVFGGLFLGLLLALFRQMSIRLKLDAQEQGQGER